MNNLEQSAGDQLRDLADNLEGLQLPGPLRMLASSLDLGGARQVLHQAAAQLDRLDEMDRRLEALEEALADSL